MDKMSATATVRAGYSSGIQPLGISRTFDENARAPIRSSDIVISATQLKSGGTGAVTLATVPAGENWRIEFLSARNVAAGASTVGIYLVPSGGSVSTTMNAVYLQSLAAGASLRVTAAEGYQLAAGEVLAGTCTADNDVIIFGRLTRITQGAT